MTTETNNPKYDPLPEDDASQEAETPVASPKEPRMPDVAVLQLPPGAVQFPTHGDFTWDGFKNDVSPLIRQLLQPKWLMVIVPLVFLYLYVTVRVAQKDWFYLGSPLLIQAIIPLLTIWLVWRRRQEVMRQYYELAFVFPEDSPKRHGKIWPLLLSVLLMMLAAIVQLTQLSVIGLIVGTFSLVYYLYGFFQLRSLWQMLAFLVLMIPTPMWVLTRATILLQLGQTALAAMVAKTFDQGAEVRDRIILHLTASNQVITSALCGITVVIPVIVLTIWLAILRRIPVLATLALVIIGLFTAVVLNTLRLILFGVMGMENPDPWLLEISNWVVVGISFFLLTRVATRLTVRRKLVEEAEDETEEDSLTADLDVILREGENAAANKADTLRNTPAKENL